jgi:hypothetical protein
LVAAADGEQRGAILDRGSQSLTLGALQVLRDRVLLLVLPATRLEAIYFALYRIDDVYFAHGG